MNDEANKEQQEEAPTGDGHPEVIMTFSGHPIMNFSLAGFQFTKGTLQFRAGDEERLAAFEKLYDSLPLMEKNRIKKIDVAAAEKLLAELKAKEGGPTQKIDSTVGDRASKPQPVGNLGRTLGNGNLYDRAHV